MGCTLQNDAPAFLGRAKQFQVIALHLYIKCMASGKKELAGSTKVFDRKKKSSEVSLLPAEMYGTPSFRYEWIQTRSKLNFIVILITDVLI